jgi:peptide/nickel transport system substrate-binding protein
VRLAPKVYIPSLAYFPRMSEAIQGYLRKVGIDWQLLPVDVSAMPAKLTPEDYDMYCLAVPYLSAGELMTFFFDSKNIPVPNRLFWNDPETDAGLAEGRAAANDADRQRGFAKVQERVMREHLMIPVMNTHMYMTANRKLKGVRAHSLFQQTIYKGLDLAP